MSTNELSLRELLAQVQSASHTAKETSTELSEQILRFEAWLVGLPMKVEASAREEASAAAPIRMHLRFASTNNGWALTYQYENSLTSTATSQERFLQQGPLDDKRKAIKLFPALLSLLQKKLTVLARRNQAGLKNLGAIVAELGIKEGK